MHVVKPGTGDGRTRSRARRAAAVTAPQRTKRIRRTPEQAEREILDAAESFLHEHDFRDLTIDEVMRRTGMARSAFYNYFQDRNELALRLLERVEGEMMAVSQAWLAEAEDPVRMLHAALSGVADSYGRHRHVMRAIHEASYHDGEVERHYRDVFIEDFVDVVTERLRADKRAGRTSVPNPGELARALLLLNANLFYERLARDQADSPAAVARMLEYIWVRAIYGEPPG